MVALVMLIGGTLFLFACPKRNQKCTKGVAPTNASPQAGVHSHHTPGPRLRGPPSCFLGNFIRRAKSEQADSSCLGPLGPSSSQSPLYSGRPSVGIRHIAPLLLPIPSVPSGHLPLIRGVGLSPPNPLCWALAGTPIKCLRCTSTAYSGITVAVGQLRMHLLNYRRTKQVGMQEAVYVRITYSQILMEEGPCGPGVKGCTVQI